MQESLVNTQTDSLMTELDAAISKLQRFAELRGGACRGIMSFGLGMAINVRNRLREQQERIAYLERLASTDELTGILNRRGVSDKLRTALTKARRKGGQGVLIFLDVDNFKLINDTFGHLAGDEVLKTIAGTIAGNIRGADFAGRIGGDEFVILMANSAWTDGCKRARDLEAAINSAYAVWRGELIPLSVSSGVQAYGESDLCEQLLARADSLMYQNKRNKRQWEAA